jgi:hypothetical protein
MSSIMRRRNGLMASAEIVEVMGGSRLEVGVFDPSILKAEPPLRHPGSVIVLLRARRSRHLLPRERVRSMAQGDIRLVRSDVRFSAPSCPQEIASLTIASTWIAAQSRSGNALSC